MVDNLIKTLRFAIIGCGRIAHRHAESILNNGKLVAVCDLVSDVADEFAKKFNTIPYYSIDELLEKEKSNIDIVSICTPNGLHAEQSIKALFAGVHVICEKPMAINPYDCGEMIKAAEHCNRRLFIVKQNRFNPPVSAVKKAIDQGIFGKIYSVQLSCFWNRNTDYYSNSWKGTKLLDGGTLYTQFSHFVDLLYWMIGDIKTAKSFVANLNHKGLIEFEDTGAVAFEFHNGAIGTMNYTVNSYKKNMEGSLTIFAENGTVKIGGEYLNELEYQNIDGFEFQDLPAGNKPNNYGNYQGSMSNHSLIYSNVVDVFTKGHSIATNSYEGLKTVEIIDKIYLSASRNI